ncbi:hypothetical protein [Caballeronia sp. LZ035]|uniref:hypothetical protein n=1 Tax=Caballeronia sp. LZ035 TaxID=3038568 RepID=UPI0028666995|nr:hypothetical protein [Caballeronia sp. LZ035]MDR5758207.1 hypothetical protein [Caballeronia sp. LZ035]
MNHSPEYVQAVIADLDARIEAAWEVVEWLQARNGWTPVGEVNQRLEDDLDRARKVWMALVMTRTAWAGYQFDETETLN